MSDISKKDSRGRAVDTLDEFLPSPYLTGVFDLSDTESVELVMARGCSQNCSYCAIHESPLRYFSFERIRDEIDYIDRHAPRLRDMLITVADMYENIPLGEKVLALLREFAERRKVRVLFYVNVSTLTHDTLVKLSDTPYFDVEVGIQSLNPQVLTTCHRLPDPEKIRRNVANLLALAPKAHAYLGLIAFLPGDTAESYWHSLDWAISTKATVAVNHLRIIPGTELYDRCIARGIKVSPEYPYFVTATDKISEREVSLISSMTSQIFFVLKVCSMSVFIKEEFFRIAGRLKSRTPYVSLALLLAKAATNYEETRKSYEGFLEKFRNTRSLDHDIRTSSLSDHEMLLLENRFAACLKFIDSKAE